jgi:hypothetical protein
LTEHPLGASNEAPAASAVIKNTGNRLFASSCQHALRRIMAYQLPSCFAPKKQGLSDSARNCRVQFTTERIISAQAQAVRYLAPAGF